MLTGEGAFTATNNQFTFELQVCEHIKMASTRALKEFPSKGETSAYLTSIHQGAGQPFQDFAARLLQASGRIVSETEASKLIVQQLAFENANKLCKEALRAHKNGLCCLR